jgi:uncharacterized protein YjdB
MSTKRLLALVFSFLAVLFFVFPLGTCAEAAPSDSGDSDAADDADDAGNDPVVQVPVTGISLDKTALQIAVPNTAQLSAIIEPVNATNKSVAWSSSNAAVAAVSQTGVVTANAAGSAVVTATTSDGGFSASCEVTVTFVSATGITLNKSTLSLLIPNSEQLIASVSPPDASNTSVIWTSSDTNRATVSAAGVVTAAGTSNGTATITATTVDGGFSASCEVTVTFIAVKGVAINEANPLALDIPNTAQLTVTVSPSDASDKRVTWSSSNTSSATVSASGVVTAVGSENVTVKITATTVDGGHEAQIDVNVKFVPVDKIMLNKTSTSIIVGKTEQLTATVSPANASDKRVNWTSSEPTWATVDANGLVTAVAISDPQFATITVASQQDSELKDGCKVTVTGIIVTGVSLNKSSTTITYPNSEQLTATVSPADATNKAVTWDSSDIGIAMVEAGLVSAVGSGTATITVTTVDQNKTAACTVTVPPITVTGVSVSPNELFAESKQLKATVIPLSADNKNVTWSSNNEAVATVDATGFVTFHHASGNAIITVTTVDGGYTATCVVYGY